MALVALLKIYVSSLHILLSLEVGIDNPVGSPGHKICGPPEHNFLRFWPDPNIDPLTHPTARWAAGA
jgi:hypothetical protein